MSCVQDPQVVYADDGSIAWYSVDCYDENGDWLGHCTFSGDGVKHNCSGVFASE